MHSLISTLLASAITNVPDAGITGIFFGCGILATGMFARFLKNRRK